jgi:mRNA interferase RelE/StbE
VNYKLMISPIARKQLDKLNKSQKQKIIDSLQELAIDPFTNRSKVDIKKLIGIKDNMDLFRLRVGQYRIIYEIFENSIWISEIVKRSGAYKFLL